MNGLHGAAAEGDVDAVARRLDAGVDANAREEYGRTLLHAAARKATPRSSGCSGAGPSEAMDYAANSEVVALLRERSK